MSKENIFNKTIYLSICLIFLITIIPQVSSAPPVNPTTQVSTNSFQIESPPFYYIKQGEDHRFHAHVINSTRPKTNVTTSCELHVYNSTGWDVNAGATHMEFETYNGIDFARTISGGNFTKLGYYAYVIQCNSTNEVGFIVGELQVTPSGLAVDTGNSIIYVGLMIILVIFLGMTLYSFTHFENLLNRVGMICLGYVLLIAITFITWNLANDFLLSSPFLVYILRLAFISLMIGAFPLVIGLFAWYVIMLFKIKEIDRLVRKGVDYDEAERRTSRRG